MTPSLTLKLALLMIATTASITVYSEELSQTSENTYDIPSGHNPREWEFNLSEFGSHTATGTTNFTGEHSHLGIAVSEHASIFHLRNEHDIPAPPGRLTITVTNAPTPLRYAFLSGRSGNTLLEGAGTFDSPFTLTIDTIGADFVRLYTDFEDSVEYHRGETMSMSFEITFEPLGTSLDLYSTDRGNVRHGQKITNTTGVGQTYTDKVRQSLGAFSTTWKMGATTVSAAGEEFQFRSRFSVNRRHAKKAFQIHVKLYGAESGNGRVDAALKTGRLRVGVSEGADYLSFRGYTRLSSQKYVKGRTNKIFPSLKAKWLINGHAVNDSSKADSAGITFKAKSFKYKPNDKNRKKARILIRKDKNRIKLFLKRLASTIGVRG